MAGITRVGAYIPFHRLAGETVRSVWGAGNRRASRPLAGFDEDPITMGVEALINAAGWGDSQVDSLYFASTSHPYAEKSNASVLAAAADLPEKLFTLDAGGSVRAGTSALKAACDAIEAGSSKTAAVVAAEKRPALPGSPDELSLCDGAAAVLLGKGEDVAAEIEAIYSWSEDFIDRWRLPGEGAVSAGDAKFIQDYGYVRQSVATVEGLLRTNGRHAGRHRARTRLRPRRPHACGDRPKTGLSRVGLSRKPTHRASRRRRGGGALLALVDALQSAEPGEHIIVAGHGSGGEAILLRATDKVHGLRTQRGVGWSVERARAIPNYGQWLKFNGLSPEEEIKPFTSPSILWKENRATMRLMAGVCRACGELQYPRQQVCNACGARDEWDERKLGRRGKIFTFIHDYLPPSPEGFITMATVELEGGGRFYGQMTNQVKDDVHIGMECELTFRLLHQGDGYYNYFWKLRPAE